MRMSDAASAHLAQRAAERGVSASAYVRALVEADRQGGAIEAPAPIADHAEALALLTARAREGSVQATRALLAATAPGLRRLDGSSLEGPSVLDELAARRPPAG